MGNNKEEKKFDTIEKKLFLSAMELSKIRQLLRMTGKEIESVFKMKPGDGITHSVHFENGFRVDIVLQVRVGRDKPCTYAELYENGKKVASTNAGYLYTGTWSLLYKGQVFMVTVIPEKTNTDDEPVRIAMQGGWLIVIQNDDAACGGVNVYFKTTHGDIVDIVNIEATKNADKIKVLTYENPCEDVCTREFILDTNEIFEIADTE